MPFLIELCENEGGLKIRLCGSMYVESKPETNSDGNAALFEILSRCTKIVPNKAVMYEIFFPDYISYQTRNESYVVLHDEETYGGNPFACLRIYDRSFYGDYIGSYTLADELSAKKYKQYQLCCADHIIDVISCSEPVIGAVNQI